MKIQVSKCGDLVLVIPQSLQETRFLTSFPGLMREEDYFYMPFKYNVVFNLVNRLRGADPKALIDGKVLDMINAPGRLAEIPKDFHFFTTPVKHQMLALRFLHTFKCGGLLLEPGMGKTKVYLDFLAMQNFERQSLVVCPNALKFVWEEEVETHRPDMSVYVVKTTDWAKELPEVMKAKIVVVNYNKAVILLDALKALRFDSIVLDEALIKDYRTQRTVALIELSKGIPVRNLMSGTLINNSPIDAFAPIRFMEPSLCGTGITNFKNRYCVVNPKNPGIIFGYRKVEEIRSMLDTCSIVMTKAEWMTLPDKVFNKVLVQMGDEQRQAFNELNRNYLTKIGDVEVSVDTPLVLASKLMQVSSGFLYYNPDADDLSFDELFGTQKPVTVKKVKATRQSIVFKDQPKAEKLVELLTGKLSDRKAIIWYNMTKEMDIISEYLTKAGITFEVIRGGEKDVGGKVRQFNRTPALRCLVCQARSVNYGITVMGTSAEKLEELEIEAVPGISPEVFTQIFYSMSFSLEMYLQQQDRIHRIGQKNVCEYYILLSNNYVEGRVMEALDDKMSLKNEMLVDWIQQNRGIEV